MLRLLPLFLILFLTACSIGPDRQPPASVHLLEWQGELDVPSEPLATGLLVLSPRAYPGHGGRDMRYREAGSELRYFARNRWAAEPAELLGAALTEALADSGVFADVAAPGSPLHKPYRLQTDLIRLEQHFDDNGSHVRLSLRYRLLDARTGQSLGHVRQDIRQSADSANPAGGVAAANQAFEESVRALVVKLPEWLGE
ncbi:ABC-type transport auxiliary lipoprotein family protein [Natronospira bacteriovora]|uniref:ABC-type transport auxiliary lipoprotein family protein n=1 Tax=Natronospira bacteriovora TaxID=3069753 RepID=A0ABU0W7M8_9GAMM|nr:ABC-type transport auxiliary lipoprotein family protein [Natronospira sp. AB-CW4]MDQ2070032.1 ABC-type transport auxiliary lipoprotein family protein [Natronospira sp. AB-CW4]